MLLAFGSLFLIILGAGGTGALRIARLHQDARQITDQATPHLYAIMQSRLAVVQAQLLLENVIAGFEDAQSLERVRALSALANDYLEAVIEGGVVEGQEFLPASSEDAEFALRQLQTYSLSMRTMVENRVHFFETAGRDNVTLRQGFIRNQQQYESAAERAQTVIDQEVLETVAVMNANAARGMQLLLGATAVSLVLALVLAIGLSRHVVNRVHLTRQISQKLATGDLTARVTVRGHDEIGEMGRDISSAVEGLNRIVGTVVERIQVLNATGEQLAQNAEQTALAAQQIGTQVEATRAQNEDMVANVTETSA
ncbi:HAMP domain-containing protein, partial [Alkalispirochaeta sphaeroplastigenens]|uniref:HAMP domain-containing protein n=1 Tax=Alkalispirochaeta sphaeroplastigenens TaxID=1187066 RepID=UPI0015E18B0A